MMTRKDYIIIAKAISQSNIDTQSKATITNELIKELEQDNPLFDWRKFTKACGVETL